MNTQAKTGVFLCKCGENIAPFINLNALEETVGKNSEVVHCETLAYPCLKPGIEHIVQVTADQSLNRIVVAGCEGRLMLKKMETELRTLELLKGQIDMVNLRGHVATVSNLNPDQKANKAAKLINASVAELTALSPSIESRAQIEGPVMVLGDGIASFSAATIKTCMVKLSLLINIEQ